MADNTSLPPSIEEGREQNIKRTKPSDEKEALPSQGRGAAASYWASRPTARRARRTGLAAYVSFPRWWAASRTTKSKFPKATPAIIILSIASGFKTNEIIPTNWTFCT